MPCTNSFGVIAERNENLNVGKVKNAMACSQKCLGGVPIEIETNFFLNYENSWGK